MSPSTRSGSAGRFAIAAKPVTVGKPIGVSTRTTLPRSEVPSRPTMSCGKHSWYQAAAYCNWLSEQEGIPKEQWCYETEQKGR